MAYGEITYKDVWDQMMQKRIDIDGRIVCQEWRDYRKWLEDVTQLPGADPKAIFRRYNALLPYQPDNVRWVPKRKPEAPPRVPSRNDGFIVTFNGQRISQKEAAQMLGLTPNAFWQKMNYRWLKPDRFFKPNSTIFDLNEFLWDDTYPDWKKPRMNQKFYLFWQGKQIKFPEAGEMLKLKPDELYEKLHARQGKTSRNCFDVEEFMWE